MKIATNKASATGRIDPYSGDYTRSNRPSVIIEMISTYLPKIKKVLDIGCGQSWVYDLLMPEFYTGIDTWDEQIQLNRERIGGENVVLCCGDAGLILTMEEVKGVNVVFETGMNTLHGIKGKDSAHQFICQMEAVQVVVLESPTAYPLVRHHNVVSLYQKNGFKLQLQRNIVVDAHNKERIISVLSKIK